MWINIIVGAFFIVLGLAVHAGKWYFLISGYNTMRKEKRANVDIRKIARLIGIFGYANGGIFILMGVLQAAGLNPSMLPATIFLIVSSLVLAFMSQRYDYNLFDERGKMRRGAGKKLLVPVVILLVTAVFVGVLMFFSLQETEVSFLPEGLEIHGMYGDVYAWEDMQNVQLMDNLPRIGARTNGSAIGSKLKGHFRTEEFGAVKLFVDADAPPFIYFEAGEKKVIFNDTDPIATKTTYEKIKAEMAKQPLT